MTAIKFVNMILHIFKRLSPLIVCVCLLTLLLCPQQVQAPEQHFEITAGFSPNGNASQIILSEIEKTEHTILIAAYTFTSKEIANALLKAHRRGVAVRVVADSKSNRGRHSAVFYMAEQGIPVRLNERYAILHHKFMIMDGKHLETGSFNYSAASKSRNAENVLLVKNHPDLAQLFTAEWQRLWDEAKGLEQSCSNFR